MDENIKKGMKKLAENAEIGVARSILRWKYKKERGHLQEMMISKPSLDWWLGRPMMLLRREEGTSGMSSKRYMQKPMPKRSQTSDI